MILLLLIQSVDADLDAMVAARDAAAYTAARDRVVARGRDALPALEAAATWTVDGWVRAVAAESCRTRITDPALAAAADSPAGLEPAVYERFRRPEPMVVPELRKLGPAVVPLLIERWRWTFEAIPFSGDEAGQIERDAMRHGILQVPGMLADARARGWLENVLRDEKTESFRQFAAVSLGQCGGSPLLASILDDRRESDAVREACARAIGHVPEEASLAAIAARLPNEAGQVRASLIEALGILGNVGAWDARGGPAADGIRRGCAEALVDALARWPGEAPAIGRALSVTAWPQSVAWVEAIDTDAARSVLDTLKPAVERRLK